MDADAGATACPECGESLPVDARFCPHCQTGIDADGEPIDLTDADGLTDSGRSRLVSTDSDGRVRASRPIRLVAGFAVSIPLAPLGLFLVGSVVDLTLLSGTAVFLAAWLLPSVLLARARVPAVAFGYSLYLVAGATVLLPAAAVAGTVESSLSLGLGTVAAASFAVAVTAAALGRYVLARAGSRATAADVAESDADGVTGGELTDRDVED